MPTPVRLFADAMAFELECTREAELELGLTCDGLRRSLDLSPGDILRESAVQYMERIPATNNGSYWRSMKTTAKFKIHQGWLTDQLTLGLTFEDHAAKHPLHRADFYYVRVLQRNGQRAWSPPIWVEG